MREAPPGLRSHRSSPAGSDRRLPPDGPAVGISAEVSQVAALRRVPAGSRRVRGVDSARGLDMPAAAEFAGIRWRISRLGAGVAVTHRDVVKIVYAAQPYLTWVMAWVMPSQTALRRAPD